MGAYDLSVEVSHMPLLTTVFLGLIAGVGGTGIGGILSCFLGNPDRNRMGMSLGFSGGIMLAAVFMELVPEAVRISGLSFCVSGLIIGMVFLAASEYSIDLLAHIRGRRPHQNHFARTALLLFFAIASHNFPEGMAIGGGYEVSLRLGYALVAALALHNIPEGFAVAVTFRLAGMSMFRAVIMTLLSGIPMAAGAFTGRLLGRVSCEMTSFLLGFAAGAMVYTVCLDILPDSYLIKEESPWGLLWGIITGTILFNII
jgi:ZIP family zinc transporter